MGLIQQQALRTTVISFLGIGIGMVSQMIMPFLLTTEEIGALALLNSISTVLAAFFCLGFTQVTLNMFSHFRDEENGHSGYFLFGVLFTIVGIVLAETTFWFFQDFFIGMEDKNHLIRSLAIFIFPIIIFKIIFLNSDIYLRMLYSSVSGAFLEGLVMKLLILIGILGFYLSLVDFNELVYVYTIALCLPGVIIAILAFRKTNTIVKPSEGFFSKANRNSIFRFGIFGLLATASAIIIISIDQLMINKMIGTEAVGVYSVLFFAGLLVNVPMRGLKRASVSIIADAWKDQDLTKIQSIYTKSVVSQSVIGFYLFAIGWACLEPALAYLPEYQEGMYVFFFIGLAQLFEVMTGVNTEIIATSTKYHYNTYLNIILAFLIIVTNYFFIGEWGIVGAAAASALALILINILRWYILLRFFGFQPFNLKFLYSIVIGSVFIVLASLMELPFSVPVQILVAGFSITILYWVIVLKLSLSEDINAWIRKIRNKFNRRAPLP